MKKIEDDLKLSQKYLSVKEELNQLDSELTDKDLKKSSDTTEVILLIKENRRVLQSKFKSGYKLANPSDILAYFKTNFPDLNQTKIKILLLSLGFIPQIFVYMGMLLIFITIFVIIPLTFKGFFKPISPIEIIILSFISIILSAMCSLSLYPSNIKPNIHRD